MLQAAQQAEREREARIHEEYISSVPAELQEVVDRVLEKEFAYLRSQVEGAKYTISHLVSGLWPIAIRILNSVNNNLAYSSHDSSSRECRGVQRRDRRLEDRNSRIQGEAVDRTSQAGHLRLQLHSWHRFLGTEQYTSDGCQHGLQRFPLQ